MPFYGFCFLSFVFFAFCRAHEIDVSRYPLSSLNRRSWSFWDLNVFFSGANIPLFVGRTCSIVPFENCCSRNGPPCISKINYVVVTVQNLFNKHQKSFLMWVFQCAVCCRVKVAYAKAVRNHKLSSNERGKLQGRSSVSTIVRSVNSVCLFGSA